MKLYKLLFSSVIILSCIIIPSGCSDSKSPAQATAKTSDIYDNNSDDVTELSFESETDINFSTDSETKLSETNDASHENSTEEDPPKPDEDALMVQKILDGTLEKRSALLDVTPLYQYPELPTGCESVSLTMALNYLGENLSLTEIASNYLIYGNDIVTGYCGDPFGDYGAGIYPPGLLNTTKNYIKSSSSPLAAADTTGTQLSDLFKLIDKGYPVVIWSTSSLRDPYNNDDEMFIEYRGYEYWWYTNEHCVILIGYDLDNGTVTINDPQYGCSLTYSIERFEYVYDKIRRMSMAVIKK